MIRETERWMHSKALIAGIFCLMILLTLTTSYYGSSDIGDYADVAKFFAGDYAAKIRSSHSYLLGFIHAPFVGLFGNFVAFKISSLLFLLALIASVYVIAGRDVRALWLMLLSPVVWYMAPWINPIQLASLFLLWAWHLMRRYHQEGNISSLLYSGIFIGLGWAFWDTILYFGVILGICFLFDKKLWHVGAYAAAILVGLLPRLMLDQALFNFAFFTTIKTFLSGFANLFGGIYNREYGHSTLTLATLVPFLLAIPLCFWKIFSPAGKQHLRTIVFLMLSLLLLLMNPQIRYLLALAPIMILIAAPALDSSSFKKVLTASTILTALFMLPHVLQIFGPLNGQLYGTEISGVVSQGMDISHRGIVTELEQDLQQIAQDFPNESFVVGNAPDDYQVLAHFYSGSGSAKGIREFVSIQDYELWKRNESTLYRKRFEPLPNIPERRQFWIEGGLKKSDNDPTDYVSVAYGMGLQEPLKLEGFSIVKKYRLVYLSKKTEKKA